MAYPAPYPRKPWAVQVEFLDGTVIDAMSDEEVIERWRRIAAWTDERAEQDPAAWIDRVLDRARVFYGAHLPDVSSSSPAGVILDRLAGVGVVILRRK